MHPASLLHTLRAGFFSRLVHLGMAGTFWKVPFGRPAGPWPSRAPTRVAVIWLPAVPSVPISSVAGQWEGGEEKTGKSLNQPEGEGPRSGRLPWLELGLVLEPGLQGSGSRKGCV